MDGEYGGNCQRDAIPIPPPSGFSAKIIGEIMYRNWINVELEMKYLSEEELELLNQLRS